MASLPRGQDNSHGCNTGRSSIPSPRPRSFASSYRQRGLERIAKTCFPLCDNVECLAIHLRFRKKSTHPAQEEMQATIPRQIIQVSYRDLAPETLLASALGLRLDLPVDSSLHDASFAFLDLDLGLVKCPACGKVLRKTYFSH